MDFESILHVARKNQLQQKDPIKCLQTKFKPPTKEQKEKARSLSEGVQKFLARKENEEKQKKENDKKQLDQLTALRAQDPKANRRIQHMLKRTKSANKSVMNDVDSSNTADTIAGPSQPDEDDYGFVSETSSALYNKLIQKMYSTPTEGEIKFAPSKKPGAGNLSNTKERVKMALNKQEEEERMPHKRKRRKHGGGEGGDEGNTDSHSSSLDGKHVEEKEEKKPPKPKRPAPPPMDFIELLKLAEKKQFEPVQVEVKPKRSEPEQLMTKKQREEQRLLEESRKEREARRLAKIIGSVPDNKLAKALTAPTPATSTSKSFSIPKLSAKNKEPARPVSAKPSPSKPTKISEPSTTKIPQKAKPDRLESETEKLRRERDEVLRMLKEKEEAMKLLEEKQRLIKERDEALAKLKRIESKESQLSKKPPVNSKSSSSDVKKTVLSSRSGVSDVKKTPLSSKSDVRKPVGPATAGGASKTVTSREFPPRDVQRSGSVREFPPKDLQRSVAARDFPPKDVRRPMVGGKPGPQSSKMMPNKKMPNKRRIEDSDEYDSEMDDFIDDGPENYPREDVSQVISQIFRYDKNKYASRDDDADECMESNWAQISKEEFYSARCGLLEDLEDIKAEKAELARKKKRVL